jgi:hypothetical protein
LLEETAAGVAIAGHADVPPACLLVPEMSLVLTRSLEDRYRDSDVSQVADA